VGTDRLKGSELGAGEERAGRSNNATGRKNVRWKADGMDNGMRFTMRRWAFKKR
jgi:hypothetical protein